MLFYVFFCFQNLWGKNYSDGDWISEDDLAKGINTNRWKILENVTFLSLSRSDFGSFFFFDGFGLCS